MELPTYQQILAEQYEETAKTVLVVANEHEEAVEPADHHPDELENQDDFNREQGSHALAWHLPKPAPPKNTSHTDVLFNKQTQVRLVNIDSRFRTTLDTADGFSQKQIGASTTSLYTSSNFLFKLKDPIKNVISVRLSSIELPNVFYAFSNSRGNTHFWITYPSTLYTDDPLITPGNPIEIDIPNGNWDSTPSSPPSSSVIVSSTTQTSLAQQIQNQLNDPNNEALQIQLQKYNNVFVVQVDSATGLLTIYTQASTGATAPISFDLDFYTKSANIPNAISYNSRSADFGLGYNMGFRKLYYTNYTSYVAEAIINTIDTNYVFLSLDPDWKVVIQETPDRTQLFSFAKVIVNSPKFAVTYDNGQNTLTKEYFLKQPTNIISIPVRLSDPYDQDIDLVGTDFSFTLEVREVLDFSLYETMRA